MTSGLSVISDIDDTIQQTDITDPQRLVRNTFLKPFRAVDGMAELYSAWQKQGVQLCVGETLLYIRARC